MQGGGLETRKNNRGQIRVTEAFLSALIIFSALAICAAFSPSSDVRNHQTLTAQGMQTLIQLDGDGTLGKLIEQNNWTELSDVLQLSLPVGIAYNLTVYDGNMQQVNSVPVSNGNLAGNVNVVEYICASQSLNYHNFTLRLQLSVVK